MMIFLMLFNGFILVMPDVNLYSAFIIAKTEDTILFTKVDRVAYA